MTKTRLEAFSDGVLAIIITIMVLDIKAPEGGNWADLKPLLPESLSYVLSFLFVGIYWGNHHHLLHTVKRVSPAIMLANLHLLFWLSWLPVATSWMGKSHFSPASVSAYAFIALLCAVAYSLLQNRILKSTIHASPLQQALQKQVPKMVIATGVCLLAIPMAFVHPLISGVLFLAQSLVWLIPDKNVEEALNREAQE